MTGDSRPPGTVTYPPEAVPSLRADMHYQLDRVFERVGRLASNYRLRERDPEQLTAELAAVLPDLVEIAAHLERLGWDRSDESAAVTLEVNDALKRAAGRKSKP
jgi:hypothetical protein